MSSARTLYVVVCTVIVMARNMYVKCDNDAIDGDDVDVTCSLK